MTNERAARKPLHGVFTSVTDRYDLINAVMTLGWDRVWRNRAVRACLERRPATFLDLCCGTGDLALGVARAARKKGMSPQIVGLDYSPPMLARAREKMRARSGKAPVTVVQGNAAALPFPAERFDAVGIAFAFRNLTWNNPLTKDCLAEVVRVLKPGGAFVVVESSQPADPLVRWGFRLYLRGVARPVGACLSNNPSAYRYLAESAASFYGPAAVTQILVHAGFARVSAAPMLFGAAALHVAVKEGSGEG